MKTAGIMKQLANEQAERIRLGGQDTGEKRKNQEHGMLGLI